MAKRTVTNFKNLAKDLNKTFDRISKMEDIATTRSLNVLLVREEKSIAADVSKEYGITQAAVRAKTKLTRATKNSKTIELKFKSARINLYKARQLKTKKGGISFQPQGGGRIKFTTKVSTAKNKGSVPYMINAKAGGQVGGDNIKVAGGNKKVPVYRDKRTGKQRTLRGASIKHMVETLEIDDKRLMSRIEKELPEEYSKQLKKANNTGRF